MSYMWPIVGFIDLSACELLVTLFNTANSESEHKHTDIAPLWYVTVYQYCVEVFHWEMAGYVWTFIERSVMCCFDSQ